MNSPNAAKELERAFRNGANGVQIHSNINGDPLDDPKYFPVFETVARHAKPVFLHPSRAANDLPDYKNETKSKYEIWWTFGWPYETSAALARLVFGGVIDKLPDLKVLAHHLGAMVPYFEARVGPGWDQLGKRTSDEDLTVVLKQLKKRPFDYFKDFYADTPVFGSRPATLCGLEFYGPDRVLFASDCPFDPERGPGYIRDTIKVLESIDMPQEHREKISLRNAEAMFGLKTTSSDRRQVAE
jgi:predicted TIM-barrel fold metal-dependent hydrolase